MPISLQADSVLPRGYILVDNQRVVTISTTAGLSANAITMNSLSSENIRTNTITGSATLLLVPVGSVMPFTTSVAPPGWLKLNGAELVRNDFPALWAFAQSSGNIVSEATWTATNPGAFSTGNTTTTFRIPDLRGEFIRGWADGKTVVDESTRGIGTSQADDFASHRHTTGINETTPSNGPMALGPAANDDATRHTPGGRGGPTGGTETRPRNVALLYCIKY